MGAEALPDRLVCEGDEPEITLFTCPGCEWSATTGAPWTRCPHCGSAAIPTTQEMVDVHVLYDVYRATSDGIPIPFGTWMSQRCSADVVREVRELRQAYDDTSEPACQHCPRSTAADERSFMCTACAEKADTEVQTLRDQIEQYRTAIKRALDTMGVANDEQLGPGGVARQAYAHLWHEYFAIPAGIPPSPDFAPASDDQPLTTTEDGS